MINRNAEVATQGPGMDLPDLDFPDSISLGEVVAAFGDSKEEREFIVLTPFLNGEFFGINTQANQTIEQMVEVASLVMPPDNVGFLCEWAESCDIGDTYTWNTDLVVVRTLPFVPGVPEWNGEEEGYDEVDSGYRFYEGEDEIDAPFYEEDDEEDYDGE